jgi:tryptophan 2,3-dioxygenase
MDIDKKTAELLSKLFEKYRLSGQNTDDYLEGLLVSNYEPYWKYIHLDSLLSLQNPKTDFNDEMIFITYHQINELYFRLILHELELSRSRPEDLEAFEEHIRRVNRYFRHLIYSFDIMTDGMRPEEFLKFRMALLPASGFQSYQFRQIEICVTELFNLQAPEDRTANLSTDARETYDRIYWKKGAIDLKTGEKTLTLRQFEKQYDTRLFEVSQACAEHNVYALYRAFAKAGKASEELTTEMRQLDTNINVNWRLAHYKSAVRYLQKGGGDVAATGGTNWQKFLPPRFQKVISFPSIWTDGEIEEWGKSWVAEHVEMTR